MVESDESNPQEAGSVSTNLPDLGKTAGDIANSKPFSELFGPAFREIGAYGGEWAKELTEKWRAKRNANASAHIEAVRKLEGPRPETEVTEKRAKLLLEWKGQAEQIDPDEEPDLSAVWRQLLVQIEDKAKSYSDMAHQIDVIKKLTPKSAHLLLHGQFPMPNLYRYESSLNILSSLGLVTRSLYSDSSGPNHTLPMLATMLLLLFLFGSGGTILYYLQPDILFAIYKIIDILSFDANRLPGSFLLAVFVPIGILLIWYFVNVVDFISRRIFRRRLTSLGRSIRKQGLRFLAAAEQDVHSQQSES